MIDISGDHLILVQNWSLDKDMGRKLESRWMGPRLVTQRISDVTIMVRKLYRNGKAKKYHVDDLKDYVPRAVRDLSAMNFAPGQLP